MCKLIFLFIFPILLWASEAKENIINGNLEITKNQEIKRNNIIEFQLGTNDYTGNRGKLFKSQQPSYGLSYKREFNQTYRVGINGRFSRSDTFIDAPTEGRLSALGFIDQSSFEIYTALEYRIFKLENMEAFIGLDLGYLIEKISYTDQPGLSDDSSGGPLTGLRLNLEYALTEKYFMGLTGRYAINFLDNKNTNFFDPIVSDLSGQSISISLNFGLKI